MEHLMSIIALWLSVGFGLQQVGSHPTIEFVRADTMTQTWIAHVASHDGAEARRSNPDDIQAFYDDDGQTVFLADDWDPGDPADVSVLVHELVHHFQNENGLTFACPAERERLAYQAQEAWLGLFGTSLEAAFQIDAMTVLVRSSCMR